MRFLFFLTFFVFSIFSHSWPPCLQSPLQAAPLVRTVQFTELTVALSRHNLLLFALLNNSITNEMEEILHSGIPLEFTFFVELFLTTQGSRKLIKSKSFTHTIQYDTLKDEYKVNFAENHNHNKVFSSLAPALHALENLNGVVVASVNQLTPNNSYKLQLKANLFHKTLPLGLEAFLPFLTWSNRETEWQSVDFFY